VLSNLENLSDLIKGSTIRLAVTGLSRAGKTVFITSLVHNLLSIAGAANAPNGAPQIRRTNCSGVVAGCRCPRCAAISIQSQCGANGLGGAGLAKTN